MSSEEAAPVDPDVTDEQIKEFREAFSIFDTDGDGFISVEELTTVVRSLGYNPSKEEVQKMIRDVDIDGNNEVDFQEFVQLMKKKLKNYYTEEIIKEAFDAMDTEGNGYITFPRLKQLVEDMGLQLTDLEVEEMMAEADVEGEGLVRYEALIELLSFDNETLYDAYKRNEVIRQHREEAQRQNEDQAAGHHEGEDQHPGNQEHLYHDPDVDGDSFDISAALEDGQVPDIDTISRQYGRKKYDKFSRQPAAEKPKIVKVPGQKVPMTKTRMAYLQRKNKAIGVDTMTITDNHLEGEISPRREKRRTVEPWLGSIHDKNADFERNFKANQAGKYRKVNSRILDDKYFNTKQLPKQPKQTKQVLQHNTVVVDIKHGVAKCGVATVKKKRGKVNVDAKNNTVLGYMNYYNQQNPRNNARDQSSSLSLSNGTTSSTSGKFHHDKQTNVVTTDKKQSKGYLEMINIKTKERMYYALWRTAFMDAIKKITDKEEKQTLSRNRKHEENKDPIQPTLLTPTLPHPLPRNMITKQHAGSYANNYRKIHNTNAQTPRDPKPVLSPSPRLKKPALPESKPIVITKNKINAMAAVYGGKSDLNSDIF